MRIHICSQCGNEMYKYDNGTTIEQRIIWGKCSSCLLGYSGWLKIHQEALKFRKDILSKKEYTEGDLILIQFWKEHPEIYGEDMLKEYM